jgi:hypothetical protein
MWRSCSAAFSLLACASVALGAEQFQRGVCFAHAWRDGVTSGYGTEVSRRSLERLRALGVDAVSLTPFGYQTSPSATEVHLAREHRGGESDQAVAAEAKQAHAAGMRVMLKPHVWIRGGAWIGAQRLPDEGAWRGWFESYRAFAMHYAELAERIGAEWFVIGTELVQASKRDRARWSALIAEIRTVYHGKLTYAANWDEREVVFWDLLDAAGVNAYQPVTQKRGASLDELRAGWKKIAAELAALAKRTRKPVIVTEVGYRAVSDAATAPNVWPESDAATARFDGEHQAHCYRAALEALTQGAPWCAGVYVWKWFSDSKDEQGPTDFSPAGKPAEKVLGELYGRRPQKSKAK